MSQLDIQQQLNRIDEEIFVARDLINESITKKQANEQRLAALEQVLPSGKSPESFERDLRDDLLIVERRILELEAHLLSLTGC